MTKNTKKKIGKDAKLTQTFKTIVLQFMGGKAYKPLDLEALLARLVVTADQKTSFKAALQELEDDGQLVYENRLYRLNRVKENVTTGTLSTHPRGFGFVSLDKGGEDVFIPKQLMLTAVDGDKVEIEINLDAQHDKGPEGKITAVLERARTHVAGTIHTIDAAGKAWAYCPILGQDAKVLVHFNDGERYVVGDRLILKIETWGDKHKPMLTLASHKIGSISEPLTDVPAAIEEFGIRADFSQALIQEAKSFGTRVLLRDIKDRLDLRKETIVTIDPETARDFDDAIGLTKEKDGSYKLGVHIADVSHYVRPGTALDAEARARCNSTYFPGTCVPMLPHELSSNLCSLMPEVNRLTISALMHISKTGELLDYSIERSVIRSAKRFTYEDAKRVLDGKLRSKHKPLLDLMVELCHVLQKKRSERGSVFMSAPDISLQMGPDGMPTGFVTHEYDITHQMIEEFMLKANELVATHLAQQNKPLPYRIHPEPAEDDFTNFVTLARAAGCKLSDNPKPEEIQAIFDAHSGTLVGKQLTVAYIKSMKLATYSKDNVGHFGLGLDYYCHFTSPIRRYADTIVHRILTGTEDPTLPLEQIAHACSTQERISARAENQVLALKKLRYLEMQSKGRTEYKAIISSVKRFGVTFELEDLGLEGFIHISELSDDYLVFDERRMRFYGERSGVSFNCADVIIVELESLDLVTVQAKWKIKKTEKAAKAGSRDGFRNRGKKPERSHREASKHASNKEPAEKPEEKSPVIAVAEPAVQVAPKRKPRSKTKSPAEATEEIKPKAKAAKEAKPAAKTAIKPAAKPASKPKAKATPKARALPVPKPKAKPTPKPKAKVSKKK